MKKPNMKIYCCSCVLAGVLLATGVFAVKDMMINKKLNLTEQTKPTPIVTQVPQTPEPVSQQAILELDYDMGNSWNDNSMTCTQVNFRLKNVTASELKNWTVKLNVPEGTQLNQGWNGKYSISGTSFTITPESYNGIITANGQVEFGCIVKSNGAFNFSVNSLEAQLNGIVTQAVTFTPTPVPTPTQGTVIDNPVGKLSVSGRNIIDENGQTVQLKGASTHGLAWFPQYVNKETFRTLRDTWGANTVRLAMYTAEYGGYCSGGDKTNLKNLINNGVNYANELGMYAIIDWHILSDANPNQNKSEAVAFFSEMANKYKDYNNVLYEICNEPNGGAGWENDIKPYAIEVINTIRQYDNDAIIIVGTPTWSQDVDIAAKSPITGYNNIMYTLHFYAATHKDDLRNKAKYALDSDLPLFVTEFSICDASGNGGLDYNSAQAWFDLLNTYNVSYVGWNLSNKAESSAFFNSSCDKTSGWEDGDLTESAKWLKGKMLER